MPLRAHINNIEKISVNIPDSDWEILKTQLKTGEIKVTLPCCNGRGTLRKSSKGLKHFVHLKDESNCDWKPESAEHIQAKVEIIRACSDNGWEPVPEYSENNWRADILASNKDKRIAFEFQWSTQSADVSLERNDKYINSKIRSCWFFRTIPKEFRESKDEYIASKEIPFFKVVKEGSDIVVVLNSKKWALYDFVSDLLKGKFKFCEKISSSVDQEIEMTFFEIICWKCGRLQNLYTVSDKLVSCCGNDIYLPGSLWGDDDPDKDPRIVALVKEIVESETKYNFKVGDVKDRFSKTVENSYVSFGCYYCDALFGDFPLMEERRNALADPSAIKIKRKINFKFSNDRHDHWCHSQSKEFCD